MRGKRNARFILTVVLPVALENCGCGRVYALVRTRNPEPYALAASLQARPSPRHKFQSNNNASLRRIRLLRDHTLSVSLVRGFNSQKPRERRARCINTEFGSRPLKCVRPKLVSQERVS